MIKAAIVDCDRPRAAELVRVLINHPDVELISAAGSCGAGKRLDQIVPGIIGECDLVVSRSVDPAAADVLFLCGNRSDTSAFLSSTALGEDVKVIDLSGSHNLDHGEALPWTYGMSEMQRRVLVHDARLVTVPGNAAIASLLALMPMARNLLLNSPITLQVAMGDLAFPDEGKTLDGMTAIQWTQEQQCEVVKVLEQCQPGFDQPVEMSISRLAERRTLAVAARFKCSMDVEKVKQLYEQYYDDHNFVFMTDRPIVSADVENTNKCLLTLMKDEHTGDLTVHAVMDLLLRGSAGTAVHMMNLLFGLHERAGLALKGTGC